MSAKYVQSKGWPIKAADPPNVSSTVWALAAVSGVVLLLMAILQLSSFTDFENALSAAGLTSPGFWAFVVIIAELWGAAGFFKLKLSLGFRNVSYALAILIAGFWFINIVQLTASGGAEHLTNSGLFGRFLAQTPGWWTVIEVSILLFWVVLKVGYLHDNQQTSRYK